MRGVVWYGGAYKIMCAPTCVQKWYNCTQVCLLDLHAICVFTQLLGMPYNHLFVTLKVSRFFFIYF